MYRKNKTRNDLLISCELSLILKNMSSHKELFTFVRKYV